MANILEKIFKKKEATQNSKNIELLQGSGISFSTFINDPYANDIYRAGVDTIARNTAKLKPIHFINDKKGDKDLNRLLQVRPNEYMNTYDFLYKVVTHYFLNNNAYIYIQRDMNGKVKNLYPISGTKRVFGTDNENNLYMKVTFKQGMEVYFPYSDIIHLRRHFNSDELNGDDNSALSPVLEVAQTQSEGMSKAIRLGANIRGILKFNKLTSDETKKEKRDTFMKDYLSLENNGGVIVSDQEAEYESIDSKPVNIDENQIRAISDKVYNYLGINRNIVSGKYTENEWQAFYESVIEPIATQLSLEFTHKIFTIIEQNFGNEIIFESNRLNYSSLQTKINLIQTISPLGSVTIDEVREILNLPKLDGEEGSRILQSLNYMEIKDIEKYQLSKSGLKEGANQNEGN
ncbi:phage portal protein [Facklamia sp. P9177]|uniref:phage portal protein n=1 Tax=Facklamia sp. P9177 TaxID=3421945 RepID=UPI003D179D44